jgi:hypothetical protein
VRWILALAAATVLLLPSLPVAAQNAPYCGPGEAPHYRFGFADLYEAIGYIMGEPLECEHLDPLSGDTVQATRNGVAVYRPATNTPTFVVGARHWALNGDGLVYWSGDALDPPASPILLLFVRDGEAQCGDFTVTWSNTAPGSDERGEADLLVTTADGNVVERLVREAEGVMALTPNWCGDILGDGSVVLSFDSFSGGAHCCFTTTIVQLGDTPRTLLQGDFGNGGGFMPDQLDGEGPLELTGSSDLFAYFDDLPYAASPFLPLVLAYDGERYAQATPRFRPFLDERLYESLEYLDQVVATDEPPQVQQGAALGALGVYTLLGLWEVGEQDVRRRIEHPEVEAWLDTYAGDAILAVEAAFGPIEERGSGIEQPHP